MIDTFQISKTFARPPNQSELVKIGWKPLGNKPANEATAFYFNCASGEPRLTLSKNRNDYWNIRAEVSIGSWLFGSNLHLPNEDELHCGLDLLSEYVQNKSGIVFDAHAARVSRVDFTRDFQVGEHFVIPIIAKFARLKLSRYTRICFDDTSVYFKNKAKEKTKQFLIYSKYHERLTNSKDKTEQDAAKGLIRLEVSFRKSAINRLANSLKLPNHHANHILTRKTSEKVIQKAMTQLYFESLIITDTPDVEKLFNASGSTEAYRYIGFLYMRDQFGEDFSKLPFVNTSQKTLKRYLDECGKAGVLSL